MCLQTSDLLIIQGYTYPGKKKISNGESTSFLLLPTSPIVVDSTKLDPLLCLDLKYLSGSSWDPIILNLNVTYAPEKKKAPNHLLNCVIILTLDYLLEFIFKSPFFSSQLFL